MAWTRRHGEFGDLYALVYDRFPRHRGDRGVLDVPRLAGEFKITTESVYGWFRTDKLPARRVDALVKINSDQWREGDPPKLTKSDLIPFVNFG